MYDRVSMSFDKYEEITQKALLFDVIVHLARTKSYITAQDVLQFVGEEADNGESV